MRHLDLRTRLLAGIGLVALLQVVVGAIVVSATRSQLIDQIDARLAVAQAPDRNDVGGGFDRSLDHHDTPDAGGNQPRPYERLGDTYTGELLTDGTLWTFFAPNSTGVELPAPSVDPDVAADATKAPVTVSAVEGSTSYRVSATLARSGDYFITAIPLDGVDATVARVTAVVAATVAAVVLVLVLVALWVLRLGIAPIKRMTATAGAIAAGDLSERVADTDERTEAGQLGAALNTMLGRIEESFDERVRAEERLRQFIADASHELRTPVATIRGYAELYRSGGLGERDDLDDAMRRTEQESLRMSRLIGDMLNLARLDQHPTLNARPVDVAALVADAGRDAQATQPDRTIDVDVSDTPLMVRGDEDLLRQVLANLVGNALVHTDHSDPVHLSARRVDGIVRVQVRDEGPGMTPEVASRITERFYRADVSRSRNRGGSGLGLAIADAAVIAHDGRLRVESAPGVGTTFTIELPAG
ncbi:MAG: ATP-binding protein [Acidimicrobiales bacterium]